MSWEKTTQRWQRFEELGFDSVWDCDHWIARADEDPRSSLDAFHDLVGRYHEAELPKLRTATL